MHNAHNEIVLTPDLALHSLRNVTKLQLKLYIATDKKEEKKREKNTLQSGDTKQFLLNKIMLKPSK